MPPRKYLFGLPVLPVRDQLVRNELLVLPVHDQNFRWLAEEGIVWCENELPVLDRYYQWSLTGSTGRCLF
jgi:hypothetical protein